MKTKTPRTNAELFLCTETAHRPTFPKEVVDAEFARALERELDYTRESLALEETNCAHWHGKYTEALIRIKELEENAVAFVCGNPCEEHCGKNSPSWDEVVEMSQGCQVCRHRRLKQLENLNPCANG
jgi:uncharacterized CHY-type Zn-finger protein